MKHARHHWGEAVGDAPWASLLPPAPGDLRIVQALVNTAHLPARRRRKPPRGEGGFG